MAPLSAYLPVILGIVAATAVSFGISAVILKADAKETSEDFENQWKRLVKRNNKRNNKRKELELLVRDNQLYQRSKIIFACDAGMGSSAMGASLLRKKSKSITYLNS